LGSFAFFGGFGFFSRIILTIFFVFGSVSFKN